MISSFCRKKFDREIHEVSVVLNLYKCLICEPWLSNTSQNGISLVALPEQVNWDQRLPRSQFFYLSNHPLMLVVEVITIALQVFCMPSVPKEKVAGVSSRHGMGN